MKIFVIDIGGTPVKVLATGNRKFVEIPSGPKMTPAKMVAAVRAGTEGWKYDVISIGDPGAAVHGRPISEPHHLGSGTSGRLARPEYGGQIRPSRKLRPTLTRHQSGLRVPKRNDMNINLQIEPDQAASGNVGAGHSTGRKRFDREGYFQTSRVC